jgi:hypothetical protein
MTTWLWDDGLGLLGNGDFNDGLNWVPPLPPNSTSDCVISLLANGTITTTAADTTINSLNSSSTVTVAVGSGDSFSILGVPTATNLTGDSVVNGTLEVGTNATLDLFGAPMWVNDLNISTGSSVLVDNALTAGGTVRQGGTVTLGNSTSAGAVTNDGVWNVGGDIDKGTAKGDVFHNKGTFSNFGAGDTVDVRFYNSGSIDVVSGSLLFSNVVHNNGTAEVAGTLAAPSSLSSRLGILGKGTLDIGAYGTVRLEKGSDAHQTVDFTAGGLNEFLDLGQAGDFGGTISGFGGTNVIVAKDLLADQRSFANGVLTLSEGTTIEAQLRLSGSYTTSDFRLSHSHGNTSIHFV